MELFWIILMIVGTVKILWPVFHEKSYLQFAEWIESIQIRFNLKEE